MALTGVAFKDVIGFHTALSIHGLSTKKNQVAVNIAFLANVDRSLTDLDVGLASSTDGTFA